MVTKHGAVTSVVPQCHFNGAGLHISKEMNLKRDARVGLGSMVIMHGAVTI